MARVTPLWRSDELRIYRFDHPVEHEDQPYEDVAPQFRASFVETGTFDLDVGEASYRVAAGDVMLSHPGLRYRARFQGKGFDDTCLTISYEAAAAHGFDADGRWSDRHVLPATNRLRYLQWGLRRAVRNQAWMAAEYCAAEVFRAPGEPDARGLMSDKAFGWYAERVHHARETLERDYAEPTTVGALARSVGMSLFHFTRVFAELTGRPPHRYLLETRLAAAQRMLREGASVTEACFACGFNNLSHFSRSFARRYGVTPSAVAA